MEGREKRKKETSKLNTWTDGEIIILQWNLKIVKIAAQVNFTSVTLYRNLDDVI